MIAFDSIQKQLLTALFPSNSPELPRSDNRHKKTSRNRLVLRGFLVGTRGFEPPTPDTP